MYVSLILVDEICYAAAEMIQKNCSASSKITKYGCCKNVVPPLQISTGGAGKEVEEG